LNAVGLEDEQDIPYATRLLDARAKLEGMIEGGIKMKNSSRNTIEWTVVKECHQNSYALENKNIGLKNFKIHEAEEETIFVGILLLLSPLTWQQQLFRLN